MNETLLMQSDEYHGFPFGAHSRVGDRIYEYFVGASEVGFIDVLDLAVAVIYGGADNLHQSTDGYEHGQFGISLGSTAALQQMDELLRRNGTVFRIADGKVIVSTDDFAHENAIVPALTALGLAGFENALREFHGALTDHRNGEYADALTKANHAFESTMKVIASKMGWSHKETATAKNLIEVMVNNGLVPAMRESALTGLRLMLESDVPTLRNKTPSAGHGAGVQRAAVPEPYVTYAINAAASNIRLLVELYHMKRQEK